MNNAKFLTDLYIRVSTDRQAKEGDSLEEQETELKKYCEFRQFEIRNIYIERGKSGSNTNRPEYQKLIEDVKAKKIQAVIVKKIDRLSRSLLDFEEFMLLLQNHNIEFISIKESFDTTSAMGKAMLRVALIFAQLEREQTSERLTDVMAFRASQGLYNGGTTAYGYTNIDKELVPYPKERQVVELIFKQFLETRSTTAVARFLNETGSRYRNNKLWDPSQIQKTLQKCVYIGQVYWKGTISQGIHQPIISEKMFNEVQEIFKQRHNVRGESKAHAVFQKLLICGSCGSVMSPCHALNWQKIKYYYYHCTKIYRASTTVKCTIKYVSFKTVNEKCFNLLLSLSEEHRFLQLENQALKHNQALELTIENLKAKIQTQETNLSTLKTKKDQYLDTLITNRFSSSERQKINTRLDEMELESKQLTAELAKLQFNLNQTRDDLINLTSLKQTLITFKTNYDQLSTTELKIWLNTYLTRITYFKDKLKLELKHLPWPVEFDT